MRKDFTQSAVDALRDFCQKKYGGRVNAMVADLGVEVGNGVVYRWFRGDGTPQLKVIGAFMDRIGAKVVVRGKVGEGGDPELEVKHLRRRVEELEERLREMETYKVKWEGHLETMRALSGTESATENDGKEEETTVPPAPVRRTRWRGRVVTPRGRRAK